MDSEISTTDEQPDIFCSIIVPNASLFLFLTLINSNKQIGEEAHRSLVTSV